MTIRRPIFRAAPDPGEAWARQVLTPLRRLRADCDVAAAVMARIAATAAGASEARPLSPRQARLAWAAGFLAGSVALGLVTSALRGAAGQGQAVHEVLGLLTSLGRVAVLLGRFLVSAYGRCLEIAAPVARAVWALFEVLTPILRGAGMAASACGVLSILISFYIFTHARAAASAPGGGRRS
ncbi:MAG: hypothetical protein DMF50_06740 [Acidobacteria bacterium]|nr:MAG: hypothetical protein DMF50_06740 [Acidobacteriota bacterium]